MVKWRSLVTAHADPAADGAVDTRALRELGEILELDDPLEEFTHDTLAAERAARLEVGITLLNQQIDAAVKPFKSIEGLAAAVSKAAAEVERLRGIAADIGSFQATLGFERGDLAAARRSAPRIFPNDSL
jgi:hypothetical protein